MRLSVIVCLLEESEGCLPAVMIFLQQRKDLLDHLSNENSQQKAAGWSLHVVALKPNPPALPLPLILLLALFFPTKSLFHTLRFFHFYSRHSSPPCICKSAFYRRSLARSIPSLFSPRDFTESSWVTKLLLLLLHLHLTTLLPTSDDLEFLFWRQRRRQMIVLIRKLMLVQ